MVKLKSLVQFSTGPVASVKRVRTAGNRSPSAVKADGPTQPSTLTALDTKRLENEGCGR